MGTGPLKRTPLYEEHRRAGARMVPFAGWEMPLSYAGILEEHRTVRTGAGLFDVSHMGVVELRGRGAEETCQRLTTNDVRRLRDGRAQYTLLLDERGGILDDLIVYRLGSTQFVLCVNAANTDADLAWIRNHARAETEVEDRSAGTALLALQGPHAAEALRPHLAETLMALPSFGCLETRVAGVHAIVARTGYTGEDGFELFLCADGACHVWTNLLATPLVRPAGLGARDTLRLEAGLPLHGADMDADTCPYEAGLERFVRLDSGPFVGRDAAIVAARDGTTRRLVRLLLHGMGIPRRDYAVTASGRRIGTVTSGGLAPVLGRGIALAMIERAHAAAGTRLAVEIRGRAVEAEVVDRPFHRLAMT
jgi:aminomethyltransferase